MEKTSTFKFTRNPYKVSSRSDSIKLLFSAWELRQKPIKFWANTGNIPKHSKLNRLRKTIKRLVDNNTGNCVDNLFYYGGSRLVFPYHVHWMGDRFEFTLYDPFGMPLHSFWRTVKSKNERFSKDEMEQVSKIMCTHYHLIWDSYLMVRGLADENISGHQEVRAMLSDFKKVLTPTNTQ